MLGQDFNKKTFLLKTLGTLALFLLLIAAVKIYRHSTSSSLSKTMALYSHLGGDFELFDDEGRFGLDNLKGKPSVLYFGFTHCPDVCPMALTEMNKAFDKIDPELHQKIQKVFVSVDYKRDTGETASAYAKNFSSDFIGLTGKKENIEKMTKAYAVHFDFVPLEDSALPFTVDHTSRFFLLTKEGKIANTYASILDNPQFEKDVIEVIEW